MSTTGRVETTLERWQDQQCEQLITLCATPRVAPVPWENFSMFARGLVENKTTGSVLKWHHILPDETGNFVRKPLIKTLLSLAAFQGVNVTDLLLAPEFASSKVLGHPRPFKWIPPTPPMYAPKVLLALRFMRSALSHVNGYLPPLDVVLRKFNVLRATANEACPQVFDQYKRRHAAQGGGARMLHGRRAFSQAVREIERKRTLPCWRGRSRPIVTRLVASGLDREFAIDIARAAFRFEATYRRLTGDSLEAHDERKRRALATS